MGFNMREKNKTSKTTRWRKGKRFGRGGKIVNVKSVERRVFPNRKPQKEQRSDDRERNPEITFGGEKGCHGNISPCTEGIRVKKRGRPNHA